MALYLLLAMLLEIGFGAAFPRLWNRLRWPTRLSRRGIAVYVAGKVALGMLVRVWVHTRVLPRAKRRAEEGERVRDELTERLGREPTDDEVFNYRFEQLRSEAEGDADATARPR